MVKADVTGVSRLPAREQAFGVDIIDVLSLIELELFALKADFKSMSASDTPSPADEDPIEEAATALSDAIGRLSVRMNTLKRRVHDARRDADASYDTDEDRARLAAALDAARAREAELEEAVETAAQAVDAAIAELAGPTLESQKD